MRVDQTDLETTGLAQPVLHLPQLRLHVRVWTWPLLSPLTLILPAHHDLQVDCFGAE